MMALNGTWECKWVRGWNPECVCIYKSANVGLYESNFYYISLLKLIKQL